MLALVKTNRQESVAQGAQITYDLTVTNHGPATAKGVSIVDTLPAGMVFVSATDGGTLAGDEVTWRIGDIPPGASRTVHITVTINGALGEHITNTARAFTPDGPGSAVTAFDTDTIVTVVTDQPRVLAATGAVGISALVLAALLLTGAGVILARRRHTTG